MSGVFLIQSQGMDSKGKEKKNCDVIEQQTRTQGATLTLTV